MLSLTGESDVKRAWETMVKPNDVLGIKSNEWGHLPTPMELEDLIRIRAMDTRICRIMISVIIVN